MINKSPKSGKKTKTRDLVPTQRQRAKELLLLLANLPDRDDAYEEFRRRFPYVVDEVSKPLARHWAMNTEQEDYDPGRTDEDLVRQYWLLPLRETLRALWCADPETKQWGMFRISQDFFQQGNREVIRTPLVTSSDFWLARLRPRNRTERLLREFLKLGKHVQLCQNSECQWPYYIASRRGRKYCSKACAKPAQRESSRKWWSANGLQWRAAQKNSEQK